MKGFTKSGQPIQGRRYLIKQTGMGIPGDQVEVEVVGKLYGRKGSADLVGVILEEVETGGREIFPWPMESADPAHPISFEAMP